MASNLNVGLRVLLVSGSIKLFLHSLRQRRAAVCARTQVGMRSAPPLKLYLQDVKLDLTVDLAYFRHERAGFL